MSEEKIKNPCGSDNAFVPSLIDICPLPHANLLETVLG